MTAAPYPEAVREIAEKIALEAIETVSSGYFHDDHVLILRDAEKIIADGVAELVESVERNAQAHHEEFHDDRSFKDCEQFECSQDRALLERWTR